MTKKDNKVKFCKEHGKQTSSYSFCPYCGTKLEEKLKDYKIELPKREPMEDKVMNKALYEARGTAWGSLGLCGNVSYLLARSNVTPKEVQAILKDCKIYGIAIKAEKIIKEFNEEDFALYEKAFEKLSQKDCWTWKLAEWAGSKEFDYTNGEYDVKKNYFKKQYVSGL